MAYCINEFHWPPKVFLNLDPYEQAFVIAAIDSAVETRKKEQKKIEQAGRR